MKPLSTRDRDALAGLLMADGHTARRWCVLRSVGASDANVAALVRQSLRDLAVRCGARPGHAYDVDNGRKRVARVTGDRRTVTLNPNSPSPLRLCLDGPGEDGKDRGQLVRRAREVFHLGPELLKQSRLFH